MILRCLRSSPGSFSAGAEGVQRPLRHHHDVAGGGDGRGIFGGDLGLSLYDQEGEIGRGRVLGQCMAAIKAHREHGRGPVGRDVGNDRPLRGEANR